MNMINNEKEAKQFLLDHFCKENKKGIEKFVEALVDNLYENEQHKLQLFSRALLNFSEVPEIDLNGRYYVNLTQLRDWRFDSSETSSKFGMMRKNTITLDVKDVEFCPYKSPQYKIKVDVIANVTHEVIEYEELMPVYSLHKIDNFPI